MKLNLVLGVFLVSISAVMVAYLVRIDITTFGGEWLTLPLLVVFGVTLFVGALTIATIVMHNLNLTNKTQALGLPPGSIRALIALSLIIIFAIMTIYMQTELQTRRVSYDGGTTWEYVEPSDAQKDFALQSLTTISTLVTSLAAFYFGTAAVETARGGGAPAINVTPESTVDMDLREQTVLYPIKVSTTPNNEAINWAIDDAKKGSLIPIKQNEFKYKTPEKIADGTIVTLNFHLVKYPDVGGELKIKIINPPPPPPPPPEATTEEKTEKPAKTETTDKDKKDKTEKTD